jgi:hypothetical protein
MVRDAKKADKEHLFDLHMKVMQEVASFTSTAAKLQLRQFEFDRKVLEGHLADA